MSTLASSAESDKGAGGPGGGGHQFTSAEVERIVTSALDRLDEREEHDKAEAKAAAARKERMTNRVSIAAFLFTMLMSFLGFVRAGTDGHSSNLKTAATKALDDADAEWALYQTRTAERSALQIGKDQLAREVINLPDDDSRVRLAGFHHAEYTLAMKHIDEENQSVFYRIQDLGRKRYDDLRVAEQLDGRTHWYDIGTRTLTLALVLISVTLLANREYLFWLGLGVAGIGALLAMNGYLLLVA